MAQGNRHRTHTGEKGPLIYTTFFDLIRELSELTEDDHLVIATATHLLKSCHARAPRLMAPVEVVGAK